MAIRRITIYKYVVSRIYLSAHLKRSYENVTEILEKSKTCIIR